MRLILIVIGLIFTALGIAGAVLPLLPTTPFLLVAVFCFARSSDRFYNWLINQKIYKEYVENFYLHRGYTLQQKIKILISLYIVIGFFNLYGGCSCSPCRINHNGYHTNRCTLYICKNITQIKS